MTSTAVEVLPTTPHGLPVRQSPTALAEQANEIREVMRAVLVEGTDYGTIPGVSRPSLFKSGAEWLLKWGGFGHKLEPVETERDADGRKYGVTYRCTVSLLHDPAAVVSTCDGYAGYDEDRFSQTVEELEAKERAMATRYQRPARADKWAAPYRAPWNSVLKMAEKRALVGATLQACAASGLFTQDMEDVVAPAAPAKDWFVENGWDGGADEEKAHLDALVAKLKDYAAKDASFAPKFREWREGEGIDLGKTLTRSQWEACSAKADELVAVQAQDAAAEAPQVPAEPSDGEQATDTPPATDESAETPEANDRLAGYIEQVKAMPIADVDWALAERNAKTGGNEAARRQRLVLALVAETPADAVPAAAQ